MIKSIATIYYNEVELDVEYYFTPSFADEEAILHDAIIVYMDKVNVTPLLLDEQIDEIYNIIEERICNDY